MNLGAPYRQPGVVESDAPRAVDVLVPVVLDERATLPPGCELAAPPQSLDEWAADAQRFWLLALLVFGASIVFGLM